LKKEELIHLAQIRAKQFALSPALVCAVIEQESRWNPWAVRYEPDFQQKYIVPLKHAGQLKAFGASMNTEAVARSCSFGLMQTMGQVARETGADFAFLTELCNPERSLEFGCSHLANKLEAAKGLTDRALQLWNGGANPHYADEVLARMVAYQ
jgi:soluble lytic murein transglycosylase-like protein